MERLTYRLNDQCDNPTDSIILKPYLRYEDPETRKKILNRLAAYEDTGLEPQDIISAVDMAKIACALHELNAYKDLGPIDHIRDLIKAEQDGRLVELPFVAMVEQSLQDGKMKPMGDQKHNGRYAVVYVDHNKWKSPLIDICGKPYNREEAENRLAALAQKGGTHEDSGGL